MPSEIIFLFNFCVSTFPRRQCFALMGWDGRIWRQMYHVVWVISSFVHVCFAKLNLFYITFSHVHKWGFYTGESWRGQRRLMRFLHHWMVAFLFFFLLSPRALPAIHLSTLYLHASILFNYTKNSSKNIIYPFYMPQVVFFWYGSHVT